MEIWVAITITAAFLQNLRSTLQKHLKGTLGNTGATFVRFGFGAPFALSFVAILHLGAGYPFPQINATFLFWVCIGAFTQIGATFLLLYLFSFRNFVVGTAYSRTEPAQAALFGLIFLGERTNGPTLAAIALSVVGVMLISVARSAGPARVLLSSIFGRNAAIGILSGLLFGIAAVAYRAASLSLGGPNFLMQAAVTLTWTILLQTIAMAAWMAWRDRSEFGRIARAWRPCLATGLVGASASFGWFAAMTLQQAAVVKAVAQIEIVFTIASSVLFFREKINAAELTGTALIVAGIVGLVLAG